MTTELTRKYWTDTLKGWAEDRLPPPQYDECCSVLGELIQNKLSDDEQLRAKKAERERDEARAQLAAMRGVVEAARKALFETPEFESLGGTRFCNFCGNNERYGHSDNCAYVLLTPALAALDSQSATPDARTIGRLQEYAVAHGEPSDQVHQLPDEVMK